MNWRGQTDLGFQGFGCLNLDEWGGFVKTVASPKMKRMTVESCHGLIFPLFLVSFAIKYSCFGPSICMNCVQPKEAGSFFPFCDLGHCLSLFLFIPFYFLVVLGMLSPSDFNLLYVCLYSISDKFFA